MEIVMITCLLIVIVLLLQDKIVIDRRSKLRPTQKKVDSKLPDIIGQPKPIERILVPNIATERQIQKQEVDQDNLDNQYGGDENARVQIPQEGLDEVLRDVPDPEEEEEEWNRHGISGGDDGLAQGVTFEELSSVGLLLQKEELGPAQREKALAIVQKIQGTELFSLLEDSMEDASRRIGRLLDRTLSFETVKGPSTLRKGDISDFDIGEFL